MAGRQSRALGARPRKTKSQLLREAKNVAVVVPEGGAAGGAGVAGGSGARAEARPEARQPSRTRQNLAKLHPAPGPPRKVVFNKPKPTKAMMARQAKAQALIDEQERKKQAEREAQLARRRGPRRAPGRRSQPPRAEQIEAAAAEILEESRHQARAGNAEVVQAVTVGDGEVEEIIIPPGVVNEDRVTIVQIVPAEEQEEAMAAAAAAAGPAGESPHASLNRSIQMISQNLNDQEAAEAVAVQEKLDDFQQARRDFIMELAAVTAPGLDSDLGILDIDRLPLEEFEEPPPPSPPRRKIYRIPDPDDEVFHLEYGRDHPAIIAAREFRARKEQEKRIEERFRQAAQEEDFDLDVPLYQNIMDADISFEEDEQGSLMPCKSRVKAPMPRVQPRAGLRSEAMYYPHSTIKHDVEELEKFFNIDKYPPIPKYRPPRGREQLPRDLWELDDPWYNQPCQADAPDLIDFSK
ncbi:uncharacterized protein [Fopius arisanus]|uniref:Uncharacterized protein n=1 Tax=Fopius arisanus TaxID=64838 RepID=A0A0C9PIJ8_9HYME|nr:PREDICTED: uncharacterized protein LOC105263053 [Fopius arisanus]